MAEVAAAPLFAILALASLERLKGKPADTTDGNETGKSSEDSASAKLANVNVISESKGDEAEGKEDQPAPPPAAAAAPPAEAPAAPPAAAAAAPPAAAPPAEAPAAAAEAKQKDHFWEAVKYGLENKNRRLDDAIRMGTTNPKLLTMMYGEPPLLVQVIRIAKTKAVNDDIQTFTGDLLGREKRAANKAEAEAARVRTARELVRERGGRITRRQRGGAQTTDLEKFTQMILNRIITESATDPSISLQAADAFAELVKYDTPTNNDKIAKYLAGVFSQFMKIKKDGKKTPNIVADVLFETMTPTDGSEFKINPRLLDQKSWLGFQNELKADPRVVIALKEKAAAAAAAAASQADIENAGYIRRTAAHYIDELKMLEAKKGDSSDNKKFRIANNAYLGLNSMKKGPLAEAAMAEILRKVQEAQEKLDKARDAKKAAAEEAKAAAEAEDTAQAKRIQMLAEKYDEAELHMPDKSEPGYATAENAIKAILKEYNDEIAKAKGPLAQAAVAKAIAESTAKVAALDKSDLESKKRAEALSKAQQEAAAAAAAEEANAKAREAAAAQTAKEAEEYERIKRTVRNPTPEELRNKAEEEQERNAAAAAAAKAAEKAKAAAEARAAALLALAPHNRRRRGGKRRTPNRRRKLRKSTFRRHRKH